MKNRVNFIGVPIDNLNMSETIEKIDSAVVNNKQIHHSVINAGKFVKMQNDKFLMQSVISSDIINADGMGIVWASKSLGCKIKERVTGIDLMESLIELANKKEYSCFFLGAKQKVVEKLVGNLTTKYNKNIVAGFRNGYFDEKDEKNIISQILKSNAKFLFVGITSPKKEIFLHKYKKELNKINLIMGVGGSFDVLSGVVKRAPKLIQFIGLEWFYRLIQEPKRMWKRYLIGNIQFLFLILKARIRKQ